MRTEGSYRDSPMTLALQRLDETTRIIQRMLGESSSGAPDRWAHTPLSAHRDALRELVPRWHFAMLNDLERNALFQEAIEVAVQPGDHVLDIGSGSGLLAMIAARSGAAHVTSCEVVPPLAMAAERIVASNGLSDVVTILNKRSDELSIGVDMPGPADVIVTEIVDCGLVGEGILPTLRHAREHLLKPGGIIVPQAARLIAVPIESPAIWQLNQVGTACGFDVAHFNEFATSRYFQVRMSAWAHRLLAKPQEVLSFDFMNDSLLPSERTVELPIDMGGTCHGVAFWFEMSLDKECVLSNGPGENARHWLQAFQSFAEPSVVAAGDRLRLNVVHSDEALFIERLQVIQ
jgi:predicted nicotinamide N-methyase